MMAASRGFGNLTTSTDVYHERVHQGVYFSASYFNVALAEAASVDILVTVAEVALHTRHFARASGEALLQLFEAPSWSALGTPLTTHNHNRLTDYESACGTVTVGPTLDDDGLELSATFLPIHGEPTHPAVEWILKKNTAYLYRLTNIAGKKDERCQLHIEWYEDLFHS